MQIIIRATDLQFQLLADKFNKDNHIIVRYYVSDEVVPAGDIYIDACFEENGPCFPITMSVLTDGMDFCLNPL